MSRLRCDPEARTKRRFLPRFDSVVADGSDVGGADMGTALLPLALLGDSFQKGERFDMPSLRKHVHWAD